MNEKYIRDRITGLRLKKGVSEYKMSLDLGHSRSYMQGISSGRSLPPLPEFLYICEYLGVTPKQFFDEETENPILVQKILDEVRQMPDEDLRTILDVIDRFNHR